jgi:hypothetical protein
MKTVQQLFPYISDHNALHVNNVTLIKGSAMQDRSSLQIILHSTQYPTIAQVVEQLSTQTDNCG